MFDVFSGFYDTRKHNSKKFRYNTLGDRVETFKFFCFHHTVQILVSGHGRVSHEIIPMGLGRRMEKTP